MQQQILVFNIVYQFSTSSTKGHMGNSMVVMTVFEKVAKNFQKLLEAILN